MNYPRSYDYSTLSEETLIHLAKGYKEEANTATLAMGELHERHHPVLPDIALQILTGIQVDKYLTASALADLAETKPEASYAYLHKYGTGSDTYLVKEVVEILLYTDEIHVDSTLLSLGNTIRSRIEGTISEFEADKEFMEYVYQPFILRFWPDNALSAQ